MGKGRLESFSDGVLAIIITIMVLQLRVPGGASLDALRPLRPVFLSYVLSFVYIGIYWNNHHHLLLASTTMTGWIQWANLHLLFWLSMLPFATGWMGQNSFATLPSALYAVILLAASIAYRLLQQAILTAEGPASSLSVALGRDWRGRLSPLLYLLALIVTSWHVRIAQMVFVAVALLWVVPDRRIEREVKRHRDTGDSSFHDER